MVDHLRKVSKYQNIPIENVEIKSDTDPAANAELKIEIDRVKSAMQNLTPDQQEVVRLRFFGGLTSREVANMMEKNDGAVREMQRAALEKLRQQLTGNG
jgi:RNA polymerase sigma-70 factor, ECF subfamily